MKMIGDTWIWQVLPYLRLFRGALSNINNDQPSHLAGHENESMYWPISQDLMHMFENHLLHWDRELKTVILSIMSPKNSFFLPVKGSSATLDKFVVGVKHYEFKTIFSPYPLYHTDTNSNLWKRSDEKLVFQRPIWWNNQQCLIL